MTEMRKKQATSVMDARQDNTKYDQTLKHNESHNEDLQLCARFEGNKTVLNCDRTITHNNAQKL
jgi:hypothetical protein